MNQLRHVLTLVAVASVAACSTTPPANTDLLAARNAMAQAQADPNTARTASVELERARQSMRRADAAWMDRRDAEEIRHLAYLTQRRAQIAQAVAAQAHSDERVQQAGAERERVRLEARTREADQAKQAAQEAQARAAQAQNQANSEGARVAALEAALQSLRARQTERGLVVPVGDVMFASGRAELRAGAHRIAQNLARVLAQYPERRILVEGYTDDRGGSEMNLRLSERRAGAFRQALLKAGVSPERIEVRGHGEDMPLADNATAGGRQKNRRVEVLFSGFDGRFPE